MSRPARHVTSARDVSIQDVASRMLQEAGGDNAAAAKKMKGYISNFPRLTDEVLDVGIATLISRVPGIQRAALDREIGRAPEGDKIFVKAPFTLSPAAKAAAARTARMGKSAGEALLNFPHTINGLTKPLRNFTGEEVLAHGQTQLLTAGTQMRNAHYLIMVGQAAGSNKIETLGASRVEALRKQADALEF